MYPGPRTDSYILSALCGPLGATCRVTFKKRNQSWVSYRQQWVQLAECSPISGRTSSQYRTTCHRQPRSSQQYRAVPTRVADRTPRAPRTSSRTAPESSCLKATACCSCRTGPSRASPPNRAGTSGTPATCNRSRSSLAEVWSTCSSSKAGNASNSADNQVHNKPRSLSRSRNCQTTASVRNQRSTGTMATSMHRSELSRAAATRSELSTPSCS